LIPVVDTICLYSESVSTLNLPRRVTMDLVSILIVAAPVCIVGLSGAAVYFGKKLVAIDEQRVSIQNERAAEAQAIKDNPNSKTIW
jgi:hypothetical protein